MHCLSNHGSRVSLGPQPSVRVAVSRALRPRILLLIILVLTTPETVLAQTIGCASQPCAGDCDGNGAVRIDELVSGVGVLLKRLTVTDCSPLDSSGDLEVTIDELVQAVAAALDGCGDIRTAAGTVIELSVVSNEGEPLSIFSARLDERGERATKTTLIEVKDGNSVRYAICEPARAVVAVVDKPGFRPGVAIHDFGEETGRGEAVLRMTVTLVAEDHCIVPPSNDAALLIADFVPGEIVVGFSDWLEAEELAFILDDLLSFDRSTSP